jgi:hypothetical protein
MFRDSNRRSTTEALALIEAERARQEQLWPRDEHPLVAQYRFYAPHLVLLKEYIDKAFTEWTGAREERDLERSLVKIAAIAVRGLEEVTITGKD